MSVKAHNLGAYLRKGARFVVLGLLWTSLPRYLEVDPSATNRVRLIDRRRVIVTARCT